ncbi:MAG: nucleoside monophosphate kinase [Candidatus Pacebacteria bacterium]|nr:nucleoside monophosphate kinase [Candidatus Paceibacterota bacterium]MCD8508021.1 nucleoside monophosphate kinase [Candidatus Paceibacterota bacterium]MCD8528246.1 nucleoside monophosphate kinase [Candidatus Paceibacterota bacterium]MCD8563801.1 nucleoside monophosphate kinase [Candidatus Paceibacterota bacterium]
MELSHNTTHTTPSASRVFLFFGVVGAGKGTQITLLQEHFASQGIMSHYLYPGNFFREVSKRTDRTADRIRAILDQGELVPDFITNAYITNYAVHNYVGDEYIILDGYPRSIEQARAVVELCNFYGWDQIDIITIDISEAEAVQRLLARGRHDDTPEAIAQRVHVYKDRVVPALQYVVDHIPCRTHVINGEQSIQDVQADIFKVLGISQ